MRRWSARRTASSLCARIFLAPHPIGPRRDAVFVAPNILFFDRSSTIRDVRYYEQPLPEGRRQYTKTQPLQYEELAPCLAWWPAREENDRAWKVPATQLLANRCNLDLKNPNAAQDLEHLPPEQLVESILQKEQRILAIMGEIKQLLGGAGA